MKKDIVMKINCVECKDRYEIPNDETYWDYNVYFDLSEPTKGELPHPYLLCPKCTERAAQTLN